jgi:sulfatase modifying factor 1
MSSVEITILFVGVNPTDTNPLELTNEVNAIDEHLRKSKFRDRFRLEQQWEVKATELPSMLMRFQPQILHFSGHGNEAGQLNFRGSEGSAVAADPQTIATIFEILDNQVRCVVLNACYSVEQAERIAEHVDVVIGMRGALGDHAALEFAAGFYEALGYGQTVGRAFKLGKVRSGLSESASADVFSLLVRKGVDASSLVLGATAHDRRVTDARVDASPPMLARPPDQLSATDRLAALHDELERLTSERKSTQEVEAAILELRREIRSGPPLSAGDVLMDRYRLVEQVGHGGFATVWRAFDRSTKRNVAVKVLHGQWANDRTRVERFMSGARQMGRLHHQAIVPIIGEPACEDQHYYFVMPWLVGGDLHRAITERGMSRSLGLAAVGRAIEGLAHAHENKLIHRDVKPANILLDEQSHGLICDFDLVRAQTSTQGTGLNQGMGTIGYAPFELLYDARNADATADLYGAAMCVLFVLTRSDPPVFVSLTQPTYVDDLDCREQLKVALRGALAHDRNSRTTTAEELVAALTQERRERSEESNARLQASMLRVVPSWAHANGRDAYGRWVSFRVGEVEQRMRWISPGTFTMGSPPDEPGRDAGEGPQHEVTLRTGFWMADTPCTQALWQMVMGENPSRFVSPTRPVESVSWTDVQAFLERLQDRVPDLEPRLPTEAQWEHACRAGTGAATYAGSIQLLGKRNAPVLDAIAWYAGNSGVRWDLDDAVGHKSSRWSEKQHDHARAGTRATGKKRPNPWGLYDMLGNVWEWCADGFRSYADTPTTDPVGPPARPRAVRGGSWASDAREIRAASRGWQGPSERVESLGFRIVRLEFEPE